MSLPRSIIGHWIPMPLKLRWRRKPKGLASMIWSHFVTQPGFREETRQALLDLAEGRAVSLKEIPRDR
jgi:hypothetical protein